MSYPFLLKAVLGKIKDIVQKRKRGRQAVPDFTQRKNSNAQETFDFILSLIGIIGSAPLWILFALAIKLGDRGPIFYTQSRVGKGGRILQVYRRWEVGSRKADRLFY